MKRRDFLRSSLIGLGTMLGSQLPFASSITAHAQSDEGEIALNLTGSILNVHDPVMIKQDDIYYLFCTGVGIRVLYSSDMVDWHISRGGPVFRRMPEEASTYVPGADSIWAPDVAFYNDKYHLYYSISTFGSNRSAIGLVTNKTLHYEDDEFEWVDQGIVVKSDHTDSYNAIDPNLIVDADGIPWLVFGSHWSGIKMIRLDYETGKRSSEDETLYSLAARAVHPRAVEGPFMIRRGEYYYLFVSFDACCRGTDSTYNVRVGRSSSITGPFVDRESVPMMDDGGTQITFPTSRYRGPGHNAILRENDQDFIVYHAYDFVQGGTPTLRISPLEWDDDGWPFIPGMNAES